MRYKGALTIPAGTLEATPETLVVELAHGIVTEVTLLFPPGHAGLTFVQVWHRARQILPLTPGQAFRGDDHLIEFTERFELTGVPYWVELRGWSPDATLDHTVECSFTVVPVALVPIIERAIVSLPEGF